MKRHLLRIALLLTIFVAQVIFTRQQAQAAPGDYLLQFGQKHHFDSPYAIARDQNGNVYVTELPVAGWGSTTQVQVFDREGNRLYKWGSYGSGDGQLSFPAGIAVGPTGSVYVAETGNDRVQIFDISGHSLGKWGTFGTQEGQFDAPHGIAVDVEGYVYVVDTGNDRVQVFDSSGRFVRKWGGAGKEDGQFDRPCGIAVTAGRVYVTDTMNKRIQVFDTSGNFIRKFTTYDESYEQQFYPYEIAVDATGRVFTSYFYGGTVEVFDTQGRYLATWSRYGDEALGWPQGIAIQGNGDVLVADGSFNRVVTFSSTGSYVTSWRSWGRGNGELAYPDDAAVDAKGNIFVTDSDNQRVEVFTATGTYLRQWPTPYISQGIALDSAGTSYVADTFNDTILVYDSTGNLLRSWGPGQLSRPFDVALSQTGNLYVADSNHRMVKVYDTSGNLVNQWSTQGSGFPIGIALDAKGNVYVANYTVQVYDSNGILLRDLGAGVLNYWARDVAVDPSGNVFVSAAIGTPEQYDVKVLVFDPYGALRAQWGGRGDDNGEFGDTGSIAVDRTGSRVIIVDTANSRIEVLAGFGNSIPNGWSTRDIGGVGVAGGATYQTGTFTLHGSGADVWGTEDAFRYVYQPLIGDGQIIARVASLQNTNGYAKAGVMIRESLGPNSAQAMMVLTPLYGGEFSRRTTTGGPTTVTGMAGIGAPYWVKLVRKGNTFSGYVSKDGTAWTRVGTSTQTMAGSVYVGLVVSSHKNTVLCTATMDGVSLKGQVNVPNVAMTSPVSGASYDAPATINLTAAATAGEGATVKQVDFFAGTTLVWTATAAPYSVDWSGVPAGTYILTARLLDTLGGMVTSEPVTVTVTNPGLPLPWQTGDVGSVGQAGSASYLNGLFTLKGAGADIWGTTDAFRYVYQTLNGDGQIVAQVSSLQNINGFAKAGVMIRGSLAANAPHAMVDLTAGYGAEFSRRTTSGGSTTVTSYRGPAAPYWVKLVRSGSTFSAYVSQNGATWIAIGSATFSIPATAYVGLVVSSHNASLLCAATMESVAVTGVVNVPTVSLTSPADGANYTAPASIPISATATGGTGATVKQVEFYSGTTLIGIVTSSPYNMTWTNVPGGSYTLTAKVTDSNGSTATSSPVTVSVTEIPRPWLSLDIGSVGLPGSVSYSGGTYTVKGAGADIWGTSDAFRFVYQQMTGNGEIIARVASLQNTNGYAKGGIMIRNGLDANAIHATVDLTPLYGAKFSRRITTGGSTTVSKLTGVTAPYWVRLVRNGSTFTGYVSSNGTNWVQVGSASISMGSTVYVGLIDTSHDTSVLCTATFDGAATRALSVDN